MALDGAYLYTIKKQLMPLIGGRIDKIHQPSREEIMIGLRTRTGGYKLLISASASSARVHLTEIPAENPKVPPMFCMLLRKHSCAGKAESRMRYAAAQGADKNIRGNIAAACS